MALDVSIIVGFDKHTSMVEADGTASHFISEEERAALGLDDAMLKAAVAEYFGKAPDQVYLTEPTPGNVYVANQWEQITANLTATASRVVSFDQQAVGLKREKFNNNSEFEATFDVSITDDVTDSLETNWSDTKSIGFTQSISYGTKFLSGDTSINLQADFQVGGSKSRTVSMGQSTGVMVDLGPGQSVEAILVATRGKLRVEIDYDVYLSGSIAVFYDRLYKRKQIWPVDVAGALGSIGKSARIQLTNVVEIGYFSDGEITLENPNILKIRFLAIKHRKENARPVEGRRGGWSMKDYDHG